MISIFMNNSLKIRKAGKNAVTNYLISTGWKLKIQETNIIDAVDLEASKNSSIILIKVQVAVFPDEPKSLSDTKVKELNDRASEIGAKAYEAKVILDNELNPKKINFNKLK